MRPRAGGLARSAGGRSGAGQTLDLDATVRDAFGNEIEPLDDPWESTRGSIGPTTGVLSALESVGMVLVTVTARRLQATVAVEVTPWPAS